MGKTNSNDRIRLFVFGLIASCAFALTFYPFRITQDVAFWQKALDAGHFLLFGVISILFYYALPKPQFVGLKRYTSAALVSSLLACFIEAVQPFVGRTATYGDLANGLLGVLAALTGVALWDSKNGRLIRITHFVVTLLIAICIAHPAWVQWKVVRWRKGHFPVLADFENELELHLWRTQGGSRGVPTNITFSPDNATHGNNTLHVETSSGSWAGISYRGDYLNLSHFKTLALDIYNPGDPFTLNIRVDDYKDVSKYGMRYEKGVTVQRGSNEIRILVTDIERGPKKRLLNVKAIRTISLFTGKREPARRFYVDFVRLE